MCGECLKAIIIANKYLSPKKLAHSMRVAQYALQENEPYKESRCDDNLFIVALLHDVVEDTECTFEDLKEQGISEWCVNWVKELTKSENENYLDYIKRCTSGSLTAKIVKRADMKDHLSLTNTLTDKLKEKYLPALPYVL